MLFWDNSYSVLTVTDDINKEKLSINSTKDREKVRVREKWRETGRKKFAKYAHYDAYLVITYTTLTWKTTF